MQLRNPIPEGNRMVIKAVIFDLDGTIATFNLDYKTVRAEVRGYLMKMGVPASVVNVNENIFDMLKKTELFMINSGKTTNMIDQIRRESLQIAEKYEIEAAANTNLLPGAVDALKELRKLGLKIGLCTINSVNSTEFILERFKLKKYFDAIITRNQVTRFKPEPEHCNAALETMNTSAVQTAMVGDSVTDIQAAKEIKATAIGLPTGVSTKEQLINQGANYIITSITDLPILIERINGNENVDPN
jgi:HAD superfamily hydrolase (TIGR01549 family)